MQFCLMTLYISKVPPISEGIGTLQQFRIVWAFCTTELKFVEQEVHIYKYIYALLCVCVCEYFD